MLHGRTAELARLSALVEEAARGHGAALVVSGAPGSGRTALLDAVAELPAAAGALRVAGVEDEAGLAYGGLDRLLRPVAGRVDELPAPDATALRGVLGRGPLVADPQRIRSALGALFGRLGAGPDGPLVVLVDDAEALDDPSADALRHVARRLPADRTALLLAAGPGFAAPGMPRLELDALADEAAMALLGQVGPDDLAAPVRRRIVDEAAGNPLALRAYAAALTPEQRRAHVRPPLVLPAAPAILARFWHRIAPLDGHARTLLTVAAAEDGADLAVVLPAAALLGAGEETLSAVEAIVGVTGQRIRFPHPLLRSAAYYRAPFAERMRVHRALARTAGGRLGRLRHVAVTTLTPDERFSAELEDLARFADPLVAACMYNEAARLSATPDERERRLRAAGQAMLHGGDYARALPRLADAADDAATLTRAMLAGDDRTALPLADEEVADLRRHGRSGLLPHALYRSARIRIGDGGYALAEEALAEATDLARATGQHDLLPRLSAATDHLAAITGRPSGAPGLAHLVRGAYDEALLDLETAWRAAHRYDWPTLAADLIEAAIGAGRPELVADPLAHLWNWARASGQPWADAVALRCRALDAAGPAADDLFTRAVLRHARGGRPFERARTDLAYGEWLRRNRSRAQARERLRAAVDAFDRLGATPWTERARGELRAAGESVATTDTVGHLTPQEQRIVRLAARGVSNRDIAARLLLSPRTVEYHLYKAFPKLGVASRGELARLY